MLGINKSLEWCWAYCLRFSFNILGNVNRRYLFIEQLMIGCVFWVWVCFWRVFPFGICRRVFAWRLTCFGVPTHIIDFFWRVKGFGFWGVCWSHRAFWLNFWSSPTNCWETRSITICSFPVSSCWTGPLLFLFITASARSPSVLHSPPSFRNIQSFSECVNLPHRLCDLFLKSSRKLISGTHSSIQPAGVNDEIYAGFM